MSFSLKKKPNAPPPLYFEVIQFIPSSSDVKYLGIILDKMLRYLGALIEKQEEKNLIVENMSSGQSLNLIYVYCL